MGEFDLIRQFFSRPANRAVLGVGDDCALLPSRPGFDLAVSTDLLVEGRHFLAGTDPRRLGWKALAVNLSDLAAMGARPTAFTLGLALPMVDAGWLEAFSAGLYDCASIHGCELVGGDTTRGPLTIAITVTGDVEAGKAIRRSGAVIGDDVWISGRLGDAALGLAVIQGRCSVSGEDADVLFAALHHPLPRVALGQRLIGLANAMIDLSDGIAGDLPHILSASRRGARVCVDDLPRSAAVNAQSESVRWDAVLQGGDDYELCFTAAPSVRESIAAIAQADGIALTRVGIIVDGAGMFLHYRDGRAFTELGSGPLKGYDHFA